LDFLISLLEDEIALMFFRTALILSSKLILALMVKSGVFGTDLGNVFVECVCGWFWMWGVVSR